MNLIKIQSFSNIITYTWKCYDVNEKFCILIKFAFVSILSVQVYLKFFMKVPGKINLYMRNYNMNGVLNARCYGGVVRIGSYVKQVRARESNVLLLDTGDHFQGTFWYFALNKLNYTAYVGDFWLCFVEAM